MIEPSFRHIFNTITDYFSNNYNNSIFAFTDDAQRENNFNNFYFWFSSLINAYHIYYKGITIIIN